MPESRKRPGHKYQKPADIPASQRMKGRIICAILFTVFGLLIAYFADNRLFSLAIGAILGGIAGYFLGLKMEKGKATD